LNRERKNQPDRQHKGTDVAKMKVGNDSHINGTDDDDDDAADDDDDDDEVAAGSEFKLFNISV